MSLYRRGDIVTIVGMDVINTFEKCGNGGYSSPGGLFVHPKMTKYCGKSFVIRSVYRGFSVFEDRYILEGNSWAWDESLFKETADPSKFSGMEDLL